jgi:hypothetical protein
LSIRISSGTPAAPSSGPAASTNWQWDRRKLRQDTAASGFRIMSQQRPPSRRTAIVCGLFAAGMGMVLILMGFGVIKPRGASAPLWIATAAGLAFLLAGTSVAVGAIHGVSSDGELPNDSGWWSRAFYYSAGLVACACLAAIGTWVAFGPGMRNFGGTGTLFLSREANEIVGRVVFGFGAILTWLIAIAVAVRAARQLFPRKSP